jgi:hypothetical protein
MKKLMDAGSKKNTARDVWVAGRIEIRWRFL